MAIFIAFIILFVCLIIGVPVAFSFGAAIVWSVLTMGYSPSFLLPTAYMKLTGVVLLAIPLFIMAGGIMEKGKIGDALIGFIQKFVGRIRGSLAVVAVITSAIFGSITGSGMATLSCVGSILAPKMLEKKYPMGIAAATLACAAPIGMLIPPSSIQILVAWSGRLSVLACFLATVVPGIILTILISVVSFLLLRNHKEIEVEPKVEGSVWVKDLGYKTKTAVPALLMPLMILGGIYGGYMTPSEAAAVSVIYAIPVSIWIYKGMNWCELKETFVDTAKSTGSIMVMLALIMVLSRVLVMENVPENIMKLLLLVSDNPKVILLMINLFLVIIGMLMDDVSGTLLCTPILLPMMADLGVNPYHFAAILGVNLGMGNITPPCAPFLYFGSNICGIGSDAVMKPALKIMLFAYLPTLILTTYFPAVSLTLPRLILGIG